MNTFAFSCFYLQGSPFTGWPGGGGAEQIGVVAMQLGIVAVAWHWLPQRLPWVFSQEGRVERLHIGLVQNPARAADGIC